MRAFIGNGIGWIKGIIGVIAVVTLGGAQAFAGAKGLPIPGSDVAVKWDNLYHFLVWLSLFFFVLIVGGMTYLVVKYRARPGVKTRYITGNHLVEAIWTFIPFVLLMVIFVWGYSVYNAMTTPPSDAYEVRVIGKQWLWQFQYEDGRTTVNELYVPVNKPVKLIMTSEDVLHSFFIPNFRVKQDVVPGMYSSVWFEATVPGKHQVYCAEYCGAAHSGMLAQVIALEEKAWIAWTRGKKPVDVAAQPSGAVVQGQASKQSESQTSALTLVEQGKKTFETKGCVACHSVDGTPKPGLGPTQKGVFGHKIELADGSTVVADENYIRESIENPTAKVVKGFNPVMPTFKGQLSEAEMNGLIAYIKSLK